MWIEIVKKVVLAKCDRCGLATPQMHAATGSAAMEIVRAAGWQAEDARTYCPRCRSSVRAKRGASSRGARWLSS